MFFSRFLLFRKRLSFSVFKVCLFENQSFCFAKFRKSYKITSQFAKCKARFCSLNLFFIIWIVYINSSMYTWIIHIMLISEKCQIHIKILNLHYQVSYYISYLLDTRHFGTKINTDCTHKSKQQLMMYENCFLYIYVSYCSFRIVLPCARVFIPRFVKLVQR